MKVDLPALGRPMTASCKGRAADELGKTIILVVHDLNFAAAYSDRIVALKNGTIAASGAPSEIMTGELLTEIFETPVAVHVLEGSPVAVYAGLA